MKKKPDDYPPGVLAIYDNQGATIDRYRVVFLCEKDSGVEFFPQLTMSKNPTHPQGVGCADLTSRSHTKKKAGEVAIWYGDLPQGCRECVEDWLAN